VGVVNVLVVVRIVKSSSSFGLGWEFDNTELPLPDTVIVVHPLAIRSHQVRIMFVSHGQVHFKVLSISFINMDWMEVRVLQVEVHDGVSASHIREMPDQKSNFLAGFGYIGSNLEASLNANPVIMVASDSG
jgi:hypothetical protein